MLSLRGEKPGEERRERRMSDVWEAYERELAGRVAEWEEEAQSVSREEFFWSTSCDLHMPPIEESPLLTLPLHIHLARGEQIGCDLTDEDCRDVLLPKLNLFWSLANISFDIVDVTEHNWSREIDDTTLKDIESRIWRLSRDPAEKNTGKVERKEIFLNQLIGPTSLSPTTFDVWIFDFIGQNSQGCCIDRYSNTVIMGRRSTKGYPAPSIRPLMCIAKTMAHELGHTLRLNHPKNKTFKNGEPYTFATGADNLMIGGTDITGGGGELLCPWQILLARYSASLFLESVTRKEKLDPFSDETAADTVDIIKSQENKMGCKCPPQRSVIQLDASDWLNSFADGSLPGEVFTSVPDVSELHHLFPNPQKNTEHFNHYETWFKEMVEVVFMKTPRYAIFLQTDIRALTGKEEKVLKFIDKSFLIQVVASSCNFSLEWHKIVTNSFNFSQKRVSHGPNWSHLLCFRREGVPLYETRAWKTPDVFPRGDMMWERGVGLNAAMTGVSFLKHVAKTSCVVDPFCGYGTILAVANALDLDSIGNDLSRKRCKKSLHLDLRYAMINLPFKHREHYGVIERLSFCKDSIPQPVTYESK